MDRRFGGEEGEERGVALALIMAAFIFVKCRMAAQ